MSTTTTTAPTTTITGKNDPAYIPRGPVDAELTFFAPSADGSAPFNYVETPPPGQPQRNYGEEPHTVRIADIRGQEDTHSLDSSAFEALKAADVPRSQTTYATFDNDNAIKETYYPEVEQLLLSRVPGAHRIVIFDHTIRRSAPNAARAPVTRVHIDQTPRSTEQRVRYHLSSDEEAEEALRGRYRIINVWRALVPDADRGRRVNANPLALAASPSVPESDLVGIEHRYPHRTGETAGVKYRLSETGEQTQAWYYWSGMSADERLLLKCADSETGVAGRRAPHTAFVDPRTPEDAPGRESIEVRALVFG